MPSWNPLATRQSKLADSLKRPLGRSQARHKNVAPPTDQRDINKLIRATPAAHRRQLVQTLGELKTIIPEAHDDVQIQHACFVCLTQIPVAEREAFAASLKVAVAPHMAADTRVQVMETLGGIAADQRANFARCVADLPRGVASARTVERLASMQDHANRTTLVMALRAVVPSQSSDDWSDMHDLLADLATNLRLPVARAVEATGAAQLGARRCMQVAEALAVQPQHAGELAEHIVQLGLRGHPHHLVDGLQILARCPVSMRRAVVGEIGKAGAWRSLTPQLLNALVDMPEPKQRQAYQACLADLDAPKLTRAERRGLMDALTELPAEERPGVTQAVLQMGDPIAPENRAQALRMVGNVPARERQAVVAAVQKTAGPGLTSATHLACLQTWAKLGQDRRAAIVESLMAHREHPHYAAQMPAILALAATLSAADLAAFLPCSQTLLQACADPALLRAATNALGTLPTRTWREMTAHAVDLHAQGQHAADSPTFARHLTLLALRVDENAADRKSFDDGVAGATSHLGIDPLQAGRLVKEVPASQRHAWLTQIEAMVPKDISADHAHKLAKWLIQHPVADIPSTLALVTSIDPGYQDSDRANTRLANARQGDREHALATAYALLASNPPSSHGEALAGLRQVLPPGLSVLARANIATAFLDPWPREPADMAQEALQLGIGDHASAHEVITAIKLARQFNTLAPARRLEFLQAAQPLLAGAQPLAAGLQHLENLLHATGDGSPRLTMHVAHCLSGSAKGTDPYKDPSKLAAAMEHTRMFLANTTPEQAAGRAAALDHLVNPDDSMTTRWRIAEALLRAHPNPTRELAQLASTLMPPDVGLYARKSAFDDLHEGLRVAADLHERTPDAKRAELVQAAESVVRVTMSAADRRDTVQALFEGHSHTSLAFAELVQALVQYPSHSPWSRIDKDKFKQGVSQALAVFSASSPSDVQARVAAIVALQHPDHNTNTRVTIAKTVLEEMPHLSEQFVPLMRKLVEFPVSEFSSHGHFRTAVQLAAHLLRQTDRASAQARIDAINELLRDDVAFDTKRRLSRAQAIVDLQHDPPAGFGTWLASLYQLSFSVGDLVEAEAELTESLSALLQTPDSAERADRAEAADHFVFTTGSRGTPLEERSEVLALLLPYMDRLPLVRITAWVSEGWGYAAFVADRIRDVAHMARNLSNTQLQQLFGDLESFERNIRERSERETIFKLMAQDIHTPHYASVVTMARQLQQVGELSYATLRALLETPPQERARHGLALLQAARARRAHFDRPYAHVDPENTMRASDIEAVGRAITALQTTVAMPDKAVYTDAIINYVDALRAGGATGDLLSTRRVAGIREIDNAWRALVEKRRNGDYGESIKETPELMELLVLIWRRIELYTHATDPGRTETDRYLMSENLVMALAECIEDDGHRVCNVGRRARFMRVLQGYCPEIVVDDVSKNPAPNILLRELGKEWHNQNKAPVRRDTAERFADQALRRAENMYGKASTDYAAFVTQLRGTVEYFNLDAEVLQRLGLAL